MGQSTENRKRGHKSTPPHPKGNRETVPPFVMRKHAASTQSRCKQSPMNTNVNHHSAPQHPDSRRRTMLPRATYRTENHQVRRRGTIARCPWWTAHQPPRGGPQPRWRQAPRHPRRPIRQSEADEGISSCNPEPNHAGPNREPALRIPMGVAEIQTKIQLPPPKVPYSNTNPQSNTTIQNEETSRHRDPTCSKSINHSQSKRRTNQTSSPPAQRSQHE